MHKKDVSRLRLGDYIEIKNHLGNGTVTKIALTREDGDVGGRYPMIKYIDNVTKKSAWCTYLVINFWPNPAKLRST